MMRTKTLKSRIKLTEAALIKLKERYVDFSHYFRWLFANFRECSLIS